MDALAQRSFACPACKAPVYIPQDLPPTSAPCPHCRTVITSPALQPPVASVPLKQEIPAPIPHPVAASEPETRPAASKTPWFVSAALLLLIVGGSWIFYQNFVEANSNHEDISHIPKPDVSRNKPINHFNWQTQARETLQGFLQATTLKEKARYVMHGQETLQRLQPLWGEKLLQEEAIHPDDFAAIFTGEEQTDPPTYLMIYKRPTQYDIKKFLRPLVTMEVMEGADKLDPLTSMLIDPSNYEMPPLQIHTYFKQTADGLLLDWDMYLQTRYRSLQAFVEKAATGGQATFRVIAVQDVPLPHEKKMQRKIYRITDPAHITDSYRIFAPANAEAAQQLSPIDWYQLSNRKAQFVPVTVVLEKMSNDEILLKKLICWDFEGLDGTAGNSPPLRSRAELTRDAESSPVAPIPTEP